MSNIKSLATMAAAATLISSAFGTFDPSSNANMVTYWGQGYNQQRLSHFCADENIDIINIAFLNQFPDQTGGYPGTNFGNQCGPETFPNQDGSPSQLLSNCPTIGPDIKTCQAAGKKVFLSLGGAVPSNQTVKDDTSAENFASFLWNSFGAGEDTPSVRPFGDAIVDGFDLDIESIVGGDVTTADLSAGYSSLVSDLRIFFENDTSKDYYISGAPQCVVPDAHLADAIETASFDFLFVQFYNTEQCSARSYFDHAYGGGDSNNITFAAWVNFVQAHAANKNTKIYLGLPASTTAANDAAMYLNVTEAREIIAAFQCEYPSAFGGAMIYEATASEANPFGGVPYLDVVKKGMADNGCSNQQPNPTTSSATASQSSTSIPSSTAASSSLPFGLAPPSSTSSAAASSSVSGFPSSLLPPSSSAPYPISSGSASSSGSTGSSGFIVPSGSASATGSSGVSSGLFPSASAFASSSAPYPARNSSSPISSGGYASPSTTGEETVSVTDVVTITSCGPEVTNCPARTKPIITTEVHVSTFLPSASSAPGNGPQSTQEIVTTIITTSYLTTCPVTQTATSGGSQIIQTGSTISTVFSTITSTICTKCVAPPTSAPIQQGTSTSPGESPATGTSTSPGESPATGTPAPSASTQEVVTTEIVTSYLTTCPVTQTVTQGGSQIVQTGSTTSTVYSTITSTICTKCVAPPTPAPTQNAGQSSTPGQSPVTGSPAPSPSAQEVITTVIEFTTLTTCPVTNTITSGTSHIVQVTHTVSTITTSLTSTIVVPATSAPAVVGVPGSGHQGPPNAVPAAGSQSAAPAAPAPASSPAKASPAVQTLTMSIVPIPVSPSQTAQPQSPVESGEQASGSSGSAAPANAASSGSAAPATGASSGSSAPAPANGASSGGAAPQGSPIESGATGSGATGSGAPGSVVPFPVSNGTTPASPSGSASPSGAAQPSTLAFKGAASRMDAGAFGLVAFVVAAVFVL